MKKTLIIALCCITALLAACKKKPVDPTPEPAPVNYAEQYVGNYVGQFTLTIATMNHQPQTSMSFPVDGIHMDIVEGTADNTVTATVTVDDESHQTSGTTTAEKADFQSVHVVIDELNQQLFPYLFNLDLKLDASKTNSDSLNVVGTFAGDGKFFFDGQMNILDEVSGSVNGQLVKQQQ